MLLELQGAAVFDPMSPSSSGKVEGEISHLRSIVGLKIGEDMTGPRWKFVAMYVLSSSLGGIEKRDGAVVQDRASVGRFAQPGIGTTRYYFGGAFFRRGNNHEIFYRVRGPFL